MPISFQWQEASAADAYDLEVAGSPNFADPVVTKSGVTGTAFDADPSSFEPGTVYYWRVRGSNAHGTGVWSDVWSFNALLPASLSLSAESGKTRFCTGEAVQLGASLQGPAASASSVEFYDDGTLLNSTGPSAAETAWIASGSGTLSAKAVGPSGETLAEDSFSYTTGPSLSGDATAGLAVDACWSDPNVFYDDLKGQREASGRVLLDLEEGFSGIIFESGASVQNITLAVYDGKVYFGCADSRYTYDHENGTCGSVEGPIAAGKDVFIEWSASTNTGRAALWVNGEQVADTSIFEWSGPLCGSGEGGLLQVHQSIRSIPAGVDTSGLAQGVNLKNAEFILGEVVSPVASI